MSEEPRAYDPTDHTLPEKELSEEILEEVAAHRSPIVLVLDEKQLEPRAAPHSPIALGDVPGRELTEDELAQVFLRVDLAALP